MYFIDVQGTLISDFDKSLIKGAKEFIDYLNIKNYPYVVITNNTKDLNFLNFLQNKGLNIKNEFYIDPFYVLKDVLKPCKIAAYGAKEFLSSLQNLDYILDYKNPQAVLIASYDDFKFVDFADIIKFSKKNIKIIAMHESSIYKKNNKLYPGVGSIMAMIKNATNCDYEVIGKPSLNFYKNALNILKNIDKNINFKNVNIISDDFKGDLAVAKNLNMNCNLVLSGKISNKNEVNFKILDGIYENIDEYLKEISCKN